MTPALEALIARGVYLFPCRPSTKRPWLTGWQRLSSCDIDVLQRWKKEFPGCFWGVDAEKSGLFILDDDRGHKPEAVNSLFALELEYGTLPITFTVRTPSGGYHYYFKGLGLSTGSKVGYGLDTKSVGGLVIAPGSGKYTITTDTVIADAPAWLIDLAGTPKDRPEKETTPLLPLDGDTAIRMAISYLHAESPAIQDSHGDAHTRDVAWMLKDFGVSKEQIPILMMEHWNDRCSPPWPIEGLEAKAAGAYRYGRNAPGCANPEAAFPPFTEAELTAISSNAPSPRFKLLTTYDLDTRPAMAWRIKGLIPSRGLFQIYGPSTSGKSFLAFDMLAAIAEGRPWFNKKTKPAPTVYVCLEGQAGLQQRKAAWETKNCRRLPNNFFMMPQSWSIVTKKDVIDLASVIPANSVIIIDTQNRAAPMIKETTSEDMGAVIEGARVLETMTGGTVGLIAHTGKDVSKGVRGHSSQLAAMDAAIEVSRSGALRAWKSVKVKDGIDGETGKFMLEVIEQGVDEDGDRVTSCVLNLLVDEHSDTAGFDLNESQAAAWESIKSLSADATNGEVSISAWQAQYAIQLDIENDKKAKNRFYIARKELVKMHLVIPSNGMYVVSALTEVTTEG